MLIVTYGSALECVGNFCFAVKNATTNLIRGQEAAVSIVDYGLDGHLQIVGDLLTRNHLREGEVGFAVCCQWLTSVFFALLFVILCYLF